MSSYVTGRYNDNTWLLSKKYRERKQLACIYAPPYKLTKTIAHDSPVFVIEMNNSVNQIIGIGLIKNKLITDKIYKVQEDTNCNRYIYIGQYYMSREQIENYNYKLVLTLDNMLFKGYTHSKRGSGLTLLPEKVLHDLLKKENIDIKREIKNIFITHFANNIVKIN